MLIAFSLNAADRRYEVEVPLTPRIRAAVVKGAEKHVTTKLVQYPFPQTLIADYRSRIKYINDNPDQWKFAVTLVRSADVLGEYYKVYLEEPDKPSLALIFTLEWFAERVAEGVMEAHAHSSERE